MYEAKQGTSDAVLKTALFWEDVARRMHCPHRKVSKMAKTLWTRWMENRENIKSEFRRYKQKMTAQLNRKSALYCTLPL